MTEEQFDALVQLIRTIADETFWKNGVALALTNSDYYDSARERKVIARVKEKLVEKKP